MYCVVSMGGKLGHRCLNEIWCRCVCASPVKRFFFLAIAVVYMVLIPHPENSTTTS